MSSGRWTNSRCRRIKLARKKARAIKREKKNRAKIARIRKELAKNAGERAYRKHWLAQITKQLSPSFVPKAWK